MASLESEKKMTNEDKNIKTDSFYMAAYIFAKGAELSGIEIVDEKVTFSFVDSPTCSLWVYEFTQGPEAFVDARLYLNALKILSTRRQELIMKSHAGET
jgi:hypothetical protein